MALSPQNCAHMQIICSGKFGSDDYIRGGNDCLHYVETGTRDTEGKSRQQVLPIKERKGCIIYYEYIYAAFCFVLFFTNQMQ